MCKGRKIEGFNNGDNCIRWKGRNTVGLQVFIRNSVFQFIVKPAMILTFKGSYPQLRVFGIVLAFILAKPKFNIF